MRQQIAWMAAALLVASSAAAQQPEVLHSPSGQGAAPLAGERRPLDFGTPSFYTPIDSYAMHPYDNAFIPNRSPSTGNLACTGASTDSRAVGQILMPHGVDIELIRIWGTDNSLANDMQVQLISSCLPDFGAAFPTLTVMATAASSGNPGAFTDATTLLGTNLADNQSCTYRVEVRLGPDNSTCDAALFFSKLRVQWGRTVPPAPAVASFTDVPVGAQFFAEVEALAASGITAGCTATTFCPENFVTRRQMAAFFGRGFGLPSQTIADPANP